MLEGDHNDPIPGVCYAPHAAMAYHYHDERKHTQSGNLKAAAILRAKRHLIIAATDAERAANIAGCAKCHDAHHHGKHPNGPPLPEGVGHAHAPIAYEPPPIEERIYESHMKCGACLKSGVHKWAGECSEPTHKKE